MARIKLLDANSAQGNAKQILTAVNKQFGWLPNIFKAMSNSPASLDAYIRFNEALSNGSLSPAHRELIAVSVAKHNGCEYCQSAHEQFGKKAGLSDQDINLSFKWDSSNSQNKALLAFTQQVIKSQGAVSDQDLNAIRTAGFSDAQVIEIISHIALNTFTNFFNNVFKPENDFSPSHA
ncbi:MAG: carboxymuconolactone decarboxylase family protein [Candidatus Auribacter fodinae]|jgi:uncharacterized peroxidase-related enzyme|uniref:Carboxymuconolactone decarboxylase family protein n=1 Tax=Candidatus Auribacter fodinae TaxID=2093366 RepID=A0A3A4QYS3_9BACT|nr:MAG: carboxymuconolactone decarboxylase family protein [Candidatus Auribacter fodinae]